MKAWKKIGLVCIALACVTTACHDKNRNRAIATMNEGIAQAERANFTGAVSRLESATRIDPDFGMPYYYLGMIRLREYHAPDVAVADLRRAADLMPEHAQTFYLLGSAEFELGDRREAQAALERAVELDERYEQAWLRLGELFESNGEITASIEAYTQSIYANPILPYGYNRLGGIYARYDHPEEAVAVFREGFANCGDPTNANDLGNLYIAEGQFAEAVEVLTQAVAMDSSSTTYNYNLGVAYARLFEESADEGDREQAREFLEVAGSRCGALGSQARCNAINIMLEGLEPTDEE